MVQGGRGGTETMSMVGTADGAGPGGPAEDRVLRALVRLAAVVTAGPEPAVLTEAAAETAREVLDADSLSLSRLSLDATLLSTLINVGELAAGEERWPSGESYRVQDYPQTLAYLRDAGSRGRWARVDDDGGEASQRALLSAGGRHSSLSVPVVVDGRIWGELWATRRDPTRPFGQRDCDLAEVIAGLVSAGLAQASAWQAMRVLARTDPLTGLANRRAIDEQLDEHVARSRAGAGPLAVAVGDVNGLKRLNDTLGHALGDDALIHVARSADAVVTGLPDALAGRLGGDEFALVLPGADADRARAIAGEWCRLSRQTERRVSLSCGVAVGAGQRHVSGQDLLRAADLAQYRAKTEGLAHPVLTVLSGPPA